MLHGLLPGDRYDRDMAVISQLHGAGSLKYISQERMPPREGQDQIDLIVYYELIDCVQEVEQPDEIEFGIILGQACFQFTPFRLIFFRHLYVVFMIYVDDMQLRLEEVKD